MSKPKALVTRPLFPAARAILDQRFEAEYWTAPERIPRARTAEERRGQGRAGLPAHGKSG